MSKVKGSWTLDTAAGKTVEELAEMNGVDPAFVTMNATVTDDSFTMTSYTGSITYKIQVRGNGFECLDDSGNIIMSVEYKADNDTLNFKMASVSGGSDDYVMKKGTADLTAATANDENEGGSEEYYEEYSEE